jgi:hypothetical protein
MGGCLEMKGIAGQELAGLLPGGRLIPSTIGLVSPREVRSAHRTHGEVLTAISVGMVALLPAATPLLALWEE